MNAAKINPNREILKQKSFKQIDDGHYNKY